MDWSDITVSSDEADFPHILDSWWSWVLEKPYKPILMTVFGDWFLMNDSGQTFFLDLLEGRLEIVSETLEELNAILQEKDSRDKFFLTGFVIAMQRQGVTRPRGQTYAYKIHPVIGGEIDSANLMLLDIEVWQAICSQIHQQVRQLKPAARIRGLEHFGGWNVRLITE